MEIGLALLFLLGAVAGNPFIPPPFTDDESGSISGAEASLDEAFGEVLNPSTMSARSMQVRELRLEELYFHDDEREVTVTLSAMQARSDLQFESREIDTVLAEQRANLELVLPLLSVQGRYWVDRQAYGDYDAREVGDFQLTLRNVTASGIAMLHVDESTISVTKTLLDYEPEEVTFKVNRYEEDDGIRPYTDSEVFGEAVQHKLWRGLTNRLNMAVRDKLRTVLSKRSLGKLIEDPETRERLEKYVITTTQNANVFVDNIMKGLRKMIMEKHKDQIKIPDIREGFERTLLIRVHGSFVADNGVAKGLSTMYRTGDTVFAKDNESLVHFYGDIGFDDINLFYNHYKADLMGLGPSGTINTKLFPLSLHIHVHVDFGAGKVYLDEFKVENVGDLEVEVTGLGFLFNWMASRITTWVVGMYRDEFLDDLEGKYDDYISSILSGYSLDDILSGRAFRR